MQTQSDVLSDSQGVPVRGASVRVATYPADVTASLFDPFTEVAITNPIFSADGSFAFKAANGTYQITISGNGIAPVKLAPFVLYDPADDPPVSATVFATSDGATKIGVGANTVAADLNALQLADYTALRAYAGARKSVEVTGYLASAAPSGIAGMFVRDDADTTTADNGGTVIVASNGERWKRDFTGPAKAEWFGAHASDGADDTAAFVAALAAHDVVLASAGTYHISTLSIGTGKHLMTAGKATTFQQIAGQSVGTRMICITGSNVVIGSMIVRGNIATDTDEQNHAIFVNATAANQRNITIGNIDGFDIRGDVVYIGCGSAYTLDSVTVGDVYGDNILRNVVSHCGGNGVELGAITGNRVGLMMFDIEPESTNAPAVGVKVAYIKGGRVGLLAPSATSPISGVEIGTLILDPANQPMCVPSYSPGAAVKDGLGVRNVLSAKIGYYKANGFDRCAIFTTYNAGELGASIEIASLEMTSCSLVDATYNAFVNMSNVGHLRVGSVKATVSTSGKYMMNNVASGRIARLDVTLGTGAQMLRGCSNMVIENGTAGPAGYLAVSSSNIAVKDVQFSGEVLGNFCTKLSFENVTATASTFLFNSGFDLHSVVNSTLGGSYYANGLTGRDYTSPLRFGVIQLWADVKGVLRIKGSAPTSDLDGLPCGQKVGVPATATTAGAPGQWAADTSNAYFYTGDGTTHTWRRVATAAW